MPKNQKKQSPSATPSALNVTLVAAGTMAIGVGAAALALLATSRRKANPAEHAAPDLAADAPPVDIHTRAPDAFRPDPTAPVPPELRESLRPATGPAPGFATDRGTAAATGGQ